MFTLQSLFSSTTPKETDIKFFTGDHIAHKLCNSSFGRTRKLMGDVLGNDIESENKLPTVIVMGMENVGKSSLIERLTKCRIFPKDRKLCTRCPIKLRLHYAIRNIYKITFREEVETVHSCAKIYDIVSRYMSQFGSDRVCDEEIIVDIYGPSLQDFEFYDLPGIVSYPPECEAKTLEICRKYMSNNTIIVCVVPATATSMYNCKSIGLVKDLKLEKQSIIALTMMDKINSADISDVILDMLVDRNRYNIDTDKHESCIDGFAECIAITNKFDNDMCLGKIDTDEDTWFKKEILGKLDDKALVRDVSDKIGLGNLIGCINKFYDSYVINVWKPSIKKKMMSNKEMFTDIILNMGTEPTHITEIDKKNIINYIIDRFGAAYSKFTDCVIKTEVDNANNTNTINYVKVDEYIRTIKMNDFAAHGRIIEIIEGLFTNTHPYVLERFSELGRSLIHYTRRRLNELWMSQKIDGRLKLSLTVTLDQCLINGDTISLSRFKESANKIVRALVFDKFCEDKFSGFDNYVDLFNENEEYVIRRSDAHNKLSNTKKYIDSLDNLST